MEMLENYLKQIQKYPLLDAEQEVELSKKIEKGSQSAQEKLVQSNLRLVVSVAKRVNGSSKVSIMDLIQEGNIGLMTAASKYHYSYNTRFSTYAYTWILQYMLRYLYNKTSMISLPHRKEELLRKVSACRNDYLQTFGREATVEEISECLSVPKKDVKAALSCSYSVSSIDITASEDGLSTIADLIPDSIVEEGATNPFTKFNNRITTKDHIMFTRQLATLIGAGLPLSASLRTVVEQTENKGMQAIGEEILTATESGKSLYEAFSAHPHVFNGVYLALIQAGEKSGTLDIALARLADQEEKDAAMLGKIRGALVYPAIILVVIIAVLLFMMFAVVPQVRDLYEDMGEELPGLTQGLVNLTDFVVNFWWLILLILVGGITGLVFFVKRTPMGKKVADTFKIHVPLFGGLFRKLYVSRFARTGEMLLSTGVPMVDSVNIAIESVSNSVVEAEYGKAIELIKGGKSLSEALTDREYMLPLVPQMTGIGEESGKIDEMLGKAAKVYEDELYEQIENISTMIEPILMVVMAGLIGVVVGGTLLPIYSLVNSVGT